MVIVRSHVFVFMV